MLTFIILLLTQQLGLSVLFIILFITLATRSPNTVLLHCPKGIVSNGRTLLPPMALTERYNRGGAIIGGGAILGGGASGNYSQPHTACHSLTHAVVSQ